MAPEIPKYFVKVGDKIVQEGDADFIEYDDQTMNEYQLMCSGRQSVRYFNINLALQRRYDLSAMFFTNMPLIKKAFQEQRDTLWIDIPIERTQQAVSEILILQAKE